MLGGRVCPWPQKAPWTVLVWVPGGCRRVRWGGEDSGRNHTRGKFPHKGPSPSISLACTRRQSPGGSQSGSAELVIPQLRSLTSKRKQWCLQETAEETLVSSSQQQVGWEAWLYALLVFPLDVLSARGWNTHTSAACWPPGASLATEGEGVSTLEGALLPSLGKSSASLLVLWKLCNFLFCGNYVIFSAKKKCNQQPQKYKVQIILFNLIFRNKHFLHDHHSRLLDKLGKGPAGTNSLQDKLLVTICKWKYDT